MRISFFSKIFLGFFVVILLFSSFLVYFSLTLIEDQTRSIYRNQMVKQAKMLRYQIEQLGLANDSSLVFNYLKTQSDSLQFRITLIEEFGHVLFDSKVDAQQMELHNDRIEILKALHDSMGSSYRYSRTTQEEMLYVALTIQQSGSPRVILRVSVFSTQIDSLLKRLKRNIIILTLILLIFSLIVSAYLARHITRPLKQVVQSFRRVSAGDLDIRLLLNNQDETRELATNFNMMVATIQKLVNQYAHQKDQLNLILSQIQEGIMVIDKKSKISMVNPPLIKMFNFSNSPVGKFYWEVIHDLNLDSLIKRIGPELDHTNCEMTREHFVFYCSGALIQQNNEIVITFINISTIRQYDELKKSFVANVSHELRTPLTAIQGYVETLTESLEGENKQYIDIIDRHTHRLTNIVNDLLILSSLEDRKKKILYQTIEIASWFHLVLKLFEKRCLEKNLELRFVNESGLDQFEGDPVLLEQMIINLLDNAIKFSESGFIEIRLRKSDEPQALIFCIRDTGIGIAPQHLDRIFERFYVVDPSRSRQLGGTGLGLSIVKHIVLMHQGKIDIKSELNQGTEVTIQLPLNREGF